MKVLYFTEVTTVEGVISRIIVGLQQDQQKRKVEHPDVAQQIDQFVNKLTKLKDMEQTFTLVILIYFSIVFSIIQHTVNYARPDNHSFPFL